MSYETLPYTPHKDTVRVIRCEDCKYSKRSCWRSDRLACFNAHAPFSSIQDGELYEFFVAPDNYCAWAERK